MHDFTVTVDGHLKFSQTSTLVHVVPNGFLNISAYLIKKD